MKNIASKILLLFLIFILTNPSNFVLAEPTSSTPIVEDSKGYFTQEEIELIEKEVRLLPESYKFIVLPSISTDIDRMSEYFFEYRKFSQDTILILLLTNDKQIYITTGSALQKKELNDEFFSAEIDKYFLPSIKEKSVSQALLDLTKGISNDIPTYIANEKSSIKIPEPIEESQDSTQETVESDSITTTDSNSAIILITAIVIFVIFMLIFFSRGNNKRK